MKFLRIRNKRYILACLVGFLVCGLKVFPLHTWANENVPSGIFAIGLCALALYLSGYCLYRAVMAVSEYFTFSDLR